MGNFIKGLNWIGRLWLLGVALVIPMLALIPYFADRGIKWYCWVTLGFSILLVILVTLEAYGKADWTKK